jgi:hypothetical protein
LHGWAVTIDEGGEQEGAERRREAVEFGEEDGEQFGAAEFAESAETEVAGVEVEGAEEFEQAAGATGFVGEEGGAGGGEAERGREIGAADGLQERESGGGLLSVDEAVGGEEEAFGGGGADGGSGAREGALEVADRIGSADTAEREERGCGGGRVIGDREDVERLDGECVATDAEGVDHADLGVAGETGERGAEGGGGVGVRELLEDVAGVVAEFFIGEERRERRDGVGRGDEGELLEGAGAVGEWGGGGGGGGEEGALRGRRVGGGGRREGGEE